MLYFDVENPVHIAFAVALVCMIMFIIVVAARNWRRPIPAVLPLTSPQGLEEDSGDPDRDDEALQEELIRALKKEQRKDTDIVEILVIAPSAVPLRQMFRVFININNFDPDLHNKTPEYKSKFETIITKLTEEDQVGLVLECSSFAVDAPYQALTWDRLNHVAVFNLWAPETATATESKNTLYITVKSIPVGSITFTTAIDYSMNRPTRPTHRANQPITMDDIDVHARGLIIAEAGFRALRYKKVFISYSRKNKGKMIAFANGLSARGFEIDFDLYRFREGEEWDSEAEKYIRESDVFFLLWSPDAASSNAVEQEWRFAEKLRIETDAPKLFTFIIETSDDLPDPPVGNPKDSYTGPYSNYLKVGD